MLYHIRTDHIVALSYQGSCTVGAFVDTDRVFSHCPSLKLCNGRAHSGLPHANWLYDRKKVSPACYIYLR